MAMIASPSSSPAASAAAPPTRSSRRTTSIYSAIMTPIYFVGFLFSLLLIDLRYTLARAYRNPDASSRLPTWLYQLIYRPQPYQRLRTGQDNGSRWHYHSKQKKLMKMEAAEAFRIRSAVLLAMAIIAAVSMGGLYYVANRLYYNVLGAG